MPMPIEVVDLAVPVNKIYQNEFAEILKDCSQSEIETLTKLVKDVKETLHKSKENY